MKILRHIMHIVLLTSLSLGISYWTLQYALGTKFLAFSGLNILFPALGLVLSPWVVFTALCLKKIIGYMWLGTAFCTPFATYFPTLCAFLYWNPKFYFIRYILPLLCIGAFVCHPVGGQSWIFALYWLIPVVISCIRHKSLFMNALSATFVQHAVGAVIWLYTIPTTPLLWHNLVPLVFFERLLFAMGIVVCIKSARFIQSHYRIYVQFLYVRILPFFHF